MGKYVLVIYVFMCTSVKLVSLACKAVKCFCNGEDLPIPKKGTVRAGQWKSYKCGNDCWTWTCHEGSDGNIPGNWETVKNGCPAESGGFQRFCAHGQSEDNETESCDDGYSGSRCKIDSNTPTSVLTTAKKNNTSTKTLQTAPPVTSTVSNELPNNTATDTSSDGDTSTVSKFTTKQLPLSSDSSDGSVPVSVLGGSVAGGVLLVLVIVGLLIFFRRRNRWKNNKDTEKNASHSNPVYKGDDTLSTDNLSMSSKDSGFGKQDESIEAELVDGEYHTIRLHSPVINQHIENTYNHLDESPTVDTTYSRIPNSKDALFDNTYSHMVNDKPSKVQEPQYTDTTYNHLSESFSSKVKGRKEETCDDTYNHTHIKLAHPKAKHKDQDDNYSHINQAGLKSQKPNVGKQLADAQKPTQENAAQVNKVTTTNVKGKKQHGAGQTGNIYTPITEGANKTEGHTYFVIEPNVNQRPKQAPYDYAVVATPDKDQGEFKVVETPTDKPHEYFVLDPNVNQRPKQASYDYAAVATPEKDLAEFKVVDTPTDKPHEYFVFIPTIEL